MADSAAAAASGAAAAAAAAAAVVDAGAEPLGKKVCGGGAEDPLDVAFMTEALAEARAAMPAGEVPVGCVFVRDGVVVARGCNETNETRNATRHAELVATDRLIAACDGNVSAAMALLRESTLYVTIEPCIMCTGALRLLGVKLVVYGAGNDRFGGCGSVECLHELPAPPPDTASHLGHPFSVRAGVCAEEAVALLKIFYTQVNPTAPVPRPKHGRAA